MTPDAPIRLLLGPQRPTVNLRSALDESGMPGGRMAVISAGWQEAEGDIDDVREIVGRELNDVGLYARAEALMAAHPKLHAAYRARQDRLVELQRLYRLRLRHLMVAARQTLRADGDPELLAPEQRHAIAQLRALDRHHLHRVHAIHDRFNCEYSRVQFEPLAEQAAEIEASITAADAVLITGGNVVVLLNRILLFGLGRLLRTKHVAAWSAGAMALADRVVLFHDRTPLGRRDPELLGAGLGIVPDSIFLPDAMRRIREKDAIRTSMYSRRFSPHTCIALDSGSLLRFENGALVAAEAARRLTVRGGFAPLRAA